MKTVIEELKQLAPPPLAPIYAGSVEQWGVVEADLGTRLPQDFKELICTYGLGEFAEYVAPYNPFSTKRDMIKIGRALHDLYLDTYKNCYAPYPELFENPARLPFFPEPEGILPWGRDDNAGMLCWRTKGEPDEWTLVFLDSHYSPEYAEFPGSVTAFLVRWLSGIFTPDTFPEDIFPVESPLFVASTTGY